MKKAMKAKKTVRARKKATAKDITKELQDGGIDVAPTEMIRVFGDFQNPLWKKGMTPGGVGCRVFVPKRFANRLKHKVVECERVDENGETYYKYIP